MSNLFYEHLEKQSDGTYLREQYKQGYKDGYAKAIDEFAEKAIEWNCNSTKKVPYEFIEWVAEQLKGSE